MRATPLLLLLGLLPASLSCAGPATGEGAERPNIVLIMADDMGWSDLGCYGGEIATPNLDRLAAGGLRFSQFYNNAKCAPTRASLLTGLYSQQVGVHVTPARMQGCVTIAEALSAAGYRTLMSGKWHAEELPTQRGFDRYFGLADGCCNYFNPGQRRPGELEPGRKRPVRRWAIDGQVYLPYNTPEDPDFYTTDAFTDRALEYLDQYGREPEPFFLYLAYTAPHYPLHAWPEDIARHRGRYLAGWDAVRQERCRRAVELGLVDGRWTPAPRDEEVPPWDEVEDRDPWDLRMAVYAAMIESMDRNIGRLLARLREIGAEENTLVLFLSDNGGCAERLHLTPDAPPGPMESYHTVDAPWANASNAPFRKYKSWNHEGGIATPMIASWPAVIERGGGIVHDPGHVIDLLPTCLELAGASYPRTFDGAPIPPCEGLSLAPLLRGRPRRGHDALFWQFRGFGAVRQGRWKLVGGESWELYDLVLDRTEQNDLAGSQPERVRELSRLYADWVERCGGKEIPPGRAADG